MTPAALIVLGERGFVVAQLARLFCAPAPAPVRRRCLGEWARVCGCRG